MFTDGRVKEDGGVGAGWWNERRGYGIG